MLQRNKENRELRKRNRERLIDTYHRLLDSEKNTDLSQMTIEKMEDIRRKTLEKEMGITAPRIYVETITTSLVSCESKFPALLSHK